MTRQIVNKEVSLNESPEVNTFQSDKNDGDMESRPSLAERNVAGGPVVEHPEAPSGISGPTRTKVPSKTLNEERSQCRKSRPCETSKSWTFRRATETAKCCARFDYWSWRTITRSTGRS